MDSKTRLLLFGIRMGYRVLAVLAGVWLMFMLSVSFLSLMGLAFDPTSLRMLIIIISIITVPFSLLAIFMNDGCHANNTSVNRGTRSNGVTV